jgi:hypothetical protein
MVYTTLGIYFRLIRAWGVGQLGTGQNVEVVVSGVAAGVTLSANGGAWELVSGCW